MSNDFKLVRCSEAQADADNYAVLRVFRDAENISAQLTMPSLLGSASYPSIQDAINIFLRERSLMEANREILQVIDIEDIWPAHGAPLADYDL